MKIAFVADSPETISSHFGQAQHVVVVTLDDDRQEVGREVRDKAHHSHHGHDHDHHDHDHHDHDHHDHDHHDHDHHDHDHHDHDHGHEGSNVQLMDGGHKHEHHHDHGQGHGHGHGRMFSIFEDCDVLVVRGMGTPAHNRATGMGLDVYMTKAKTVDEALAAYKAGSLDNDIRRVHSH